MIRYEVNLRKLYSEITATDPAWLENARRKTEEFRRRRRYDEVSGTWSSIKAVYMVLQHNKCPYCERKLESEEFGKIEWDLEHFRPKGAVTRWPRADDPSAPAFDFSTGSASDHGYYLLAYHPLNYLASCKVCNSTFKSNFFPIGKRRSFRERDPRKLRKERAYLPYSLGRFDDDPESLITFQGYICVPVHNSGYKHNRAILTIELLGLNVRDTLLYDRAEIITFSYAMLALQEADVSDPVTIDFFERLDKPGFRHASCARSFVQTFRSDRDLALEYLTKARQYLSSKGS